MNKTQKPSKHKNLISSRAADPKFPRTRKCSNNTNNPWVIRPNRCSSSQRTKCRTSRKFLICSTKRKIKQLMSRTWKPLWVVFKETPPRSESLLTIWALKSLLTSSLTLCRRLRTASSTTKRTSKLKTSSSYTNPSRTQMAVVLPTFRQTQRCLTFCACLRSTDASAKNKAITRRLVSRGPNSKSYSVKRPKDKKIISAPPKNRSSRILKLPKRRNFWNFRKLGTIICPITRPLHICPSKNSR